MITLLVALRDFFVAAAPVVARGAHLVIRRVGGRGRAHRIDKGEGRFGELAHGLRALRSRSRGIKRYCGLHPCERRRCALERRATI